MDNSDGQPLASRNIDLFLNLISSNETDQLMGDSASEFPKDYDWSQPAKSWWRYFKKQTDQNTAMCYTCGAIFNRGPKQSTTSLSHHLKMYHREQFILIQQAKDEDLRHGNKSNHRSSAKRREVSDEQESNDDYVNRKKSAFNLSLINAVKEKPELYDNQKRQPDELNDIWEQIALEVGVTAQIAKKCWQSLCQRYRKEMKIAVRDNFAYKPKWPYFWDLNFLDEYFKSAENRRQSVSPPTELQPLSYLNGASNMASNINIFSNILSVACAKSPLVDEEEDASTDSAIASSEHSGGDQECQLEHNEKQDSAFITIQKLLSTANINQQPKEPVEEVEKFLPKRCRSRKAPPARLSKPTVNCSTVNQGSFDWLNDEDMLFGKIVALRLRNLTVDKKKQTKIMIEQIFERQERGLSLQFFDD